MTYVGYQNPSALDLAEVSRVESEVQSAARTLLHHLWGKVCEPGLDKAQQTDWHCNAGNTNLVLEAFLEALANEEQK